MDNHLERLIRQSIPFPSPREKAHVGILYIAYHLNSHSQELFKQYQLTLQQYNILRILRGQYPRPANISLLRERMLDKMSDASRLVNRLFRMNYVTKTANPQDKRNADVLITERALDLLREIDQKMREQYTIIDELSTVEQQKLNELLDKMMAHL